MGDLAKPVVSENTSWGSQPQPMTIINQPPRSNNYWDDSEIIQVPSMSANIVSDSSTAIAAPPTSYIGRDIADIESLNSQLTLPTQPEPGVNLSLLTSVVRPPDQVFEQNEIWDKDHLLMELSRVIRDEAEVSNE